MSRVGRGALTFLVVGAAAWLWVHDRAAHVGVFFFLFFGGISGLVAAAGTKTRSKIGPDYEVSEQSRCDENNEVRPFVDRLGMHRFPGDVLDLANHPLPGANGMIGERAGLTSAFGDQT